MLDTTLSEVKWKSTGYPLHSPVSPSLSHPCVIVCHQISTGLQRSDGDVPTALVDHPDEGCQVIINNGNCVQVDGTSHPGRLRSSAPAPSEPMANAELQRKRSETPVGLVRSVWTKVGKPTRGSKAKWATRFLVEAATREAVQNLAAFPAIFRYRKCERNSHVFQNSSPNQWSL